jgi:hypothetical protein
MLTSSQKNNNFLYVYIYIYKYIIFMSGFFSNNNNNDETIPVLEKKPSELKSVGHIDQGFNGTCSSHALSRSMCRTFQVLTIIDGPSVEIFYTLIYLMIQKLFNIDCNEGMDIEIIPDIINKILKTFDDYINGNIYHNSYSDLYNYKYSDIKCKYKINGSNELCNISHEPILKGLKENQLSQFKSKFKILYNMKDALPIRNCIYNFSMDKENYPNYMIRDLLKKKLQPYLCYYYMDGSHAVVLRSWGVEYDEDGNKNESNLSVFCYRNTWAEEDKRCYNNINSLYDNTNKPQIFVYCLDYNLEIIKKNNEELYDEIIKRRDEYYDTISSKYIYEEINYLEDGVYGGKFKDGKPEGYGKMEYYNGDIYDGKWINGIKNGKGKMKYEDGNVYKGIWKDGLPNETGKMEYYNGDIYDGEWENGDMIKGKINYEDGNIYDGEVMKTNGLPEGQGKMIYKNGDIYEGKWENGYMIKGKINYENGNIYEGELKDGSYEGQGKLIYSDGYIYEGKWENGNLLENINYNNSSGGNKRKTNKRRTNKRKTKKRRTNKRKTKKIYKK